MKESVTLAGLAVMPVVGRAARCEVHGVPSSAPVRRVGSLCWFSTRVSPCDLMQVRY